MSGHQRGGETLGRNQKANNEIRFGDRRNWKKCFTDRFTELPRTKFLITIEVNGFVILVLIIIGHNRTVNFNLTFLMLDVIRRKELLWQEANGKRKSRGRLRCKCNFRVLSDFEHFCCHTI